MRIEGRNIIDDGGRVLILRGVNLGGSSKTPKTEASAKEMSFVGRPFPLAEAADHFGRLARRGMTFLRFVITWEALEHSGPGLYDERYIDYLRELLAAAAQCGVSVFMDPHQDVWSRWTGGDGAPLWTLEAAGFDTSRFDEAGAAITGKNLGQMMWPANYNRYAAATMFSLFFAGKAYAPDCTVGGENIQEWLQRHYVTAFVHCYERLKDCTAVAGWGVINEPHNGFIGAQDLARVENPVIPVGAVPSPFQAMAAASGYPVTVNVYAPGLLGYWVRGRKTLNPDGVSVFRPGADCPWRKAGVWDAGGAPPQGQPRLLKPDYFAVYQGRRADFFEDFYKPFLRRFIAEMSRVNSKALFFIEGIPNGSHPAWGPADGPANVVNAFHKYDGFTLFLKTFIPFFSADTDASPPRVLLGRRRVAAGYEAALKHGRDWTAAHMGDMPAMLGEFGVPFDLNRGRSFRTGDYRPQEEALSMYYDAVDAQLLHSTIWNYTADNTNAAGDGWNGEDLSLFSEGKERALAGWLRPYPMATAGTPIAYRWDRRKRLFRYRYRTDPAVTAPTEIFLPAEWFGADTAVLFSEVKAAFTLNPDEQRLFITYRGPAAELDVSVKG